MKERTEPVIALYQALMEELKARIACVDQATLGLLTSLPPQTVREFCFLQLRLCCELIALGCLAVHGDISASTKLRKDYQADKIIHGLNELNESSFPQAVTVLKTPEFSEIHPKSGQLNKSEFIKLYRECSDHLHKGSLRNLLKGNFPRQVRYPEITFHAQKILDLLSLHSILEPRTGKIILCELKSLPHGTCIVYRAERMRDPILTRDRAQGTKG